MKVFVCAVLLGLFCLLLPAMAKTSAPKVQVYSRTPGEMGKPNIFICHVSGFHPPEISIDLFKNGNQMPRASQTDLAFGETWHYHLTKHVSFTPSKGDLYACKVTHMGKTQTYYWEPDM